MTTKDEMDRIFARHCAAEADKDIGAILDTLTDDVEHDAVGDPRGVLRDKTAIAERYRDIFDALDEDKMETVHRYYGADFFVDESHWYGRVVGDFMGVPGGGRPVDFRILHVCEIRDGRMSRENVWLDVAAIMQQLAPAQ
ncbi:ester cyclase [Nocardia yamanashiensis]|uniref:ester cyclase n=1 Tax=Nocardia yamanashiensis TaxID=209247 RepID=UPI001E30F21A|nr:ester cyclase [Nocardia yamanashiensis]UGT45034.1 ester cyclase [Nocardia yamanashiensis]